MKRKLVISSVVLISVVVAAAGAVKILVKPEKIRDLALARARETSGYAIDAGPASLHLALNGAGIRVEGLRLVSPDNGKRLDADHVDVLVKLLPLLQRRVELQEVVLHRPRFVLTQTQDEVEVSGSQDESGAAFAFLAVESWKIEDGSYRQVGEWGELELHQLDLFGGLSWNPQTGGEGKAGGHIGDGYTRGSLGRVEIPPVTVDLAFFMNASSDSLRLDPITLTGERLHAQLTGEYHKGGQEWEGALTGGVAAAPWEAVAALLPDETARRMQALDLSGTVAVADLNIERRVQEPRNRFSGTLEFSDFSIRAPQAPLGLTGAQATVYFDPEGARIENGAGRLGDDALTFSGKIQGTDQKHARLTVATEMAATTVSRLLPASQGVSLEEGSVLLDLTADVPLPVTTIPRIEGFVDLQNLSGRVRELPLRNTAGRIRFSEGGARVEGLRTNWGRSDFVVEGTVQDLAKPDFRFHWVSERLDVNELLPKEDPGGDETPSQSKLIALPGSGTVEIGTLIYRNLQFNTVTAGLRIGRDGVFVDDLAASLAGGRMNGGIKVLPQSAGTFSYEGNLNASGVPIGPVLAGWSGAAARLEGTLDGSTDLSGLAGGDLDFRQALSMSGGVKLRDGAFQNIPGLRSLAESLKIKEIRGERWPFQNMLLDFTVREGSVILDTLHVAQAGLAWDMKGRIGLDANLDLAGTLRADPAHITLPPQVAFLAPYVSEPGGKIPLDFVVTGSASSPRTSLDWDGLTERAKNKAREEESKKLEKRLEETVKDPETLDALKKKLFGGN